MSESGLEVTFKDDRKSLCASPGHSRLIARGYDDALTLVSSTSSPIDPISALRYRAEAGDAEAQYLLGEMYAGGHGVDRSYSEAVHWLLEAALNGIESAKEILAWLAPEILLEAGLCGEGLWEHLSL